MGKRLEEDVLSKADKGLQLEYKRIQINKETQ